MITADLPPDDLPAIDRAICALTSEVLPLSTLEPVNSDEEKHKVAADVKYNPQFRYRPQDQQHLGSLLATIDAIQLSTEGVRTFLLQARDYLRARLLLRMRLGEDEHWRELVYPLPPERVISLARRVLTTPRPQSSNVTREFQAEDVMRLMRARLREYGLHDWQVVARPKISSTNTDSANRMVNIRAEARYTMEEMKRLVVHEIDTHVLRAANGYCQPYRVFAMGAVPSYLTTEEGLAVVNEERMGYIDVARTRTFAGRVLAAVRATSGSFAEIYAEQRDHGFTHDEAFTTATRVKRGLADTTQPGGFIKDQAYLWGRLMVEDYVLTGGDLSRLYVGKIAIEHLPIVHELGLRPARYVPLPFVGG